MNSVVSGACVQHSWLLGLLRIALQLLAFGGHGYNCCLVPYLSCAWDHANLREKHVSNIMKHAETFCIFDVGIWADLHSTFTQSPPHT